jgi:hypothetical protein
LVINSFYFIVFYWKNSVFVQSSWLLWYTFKYMKKKITPVKSINTTTITFFLIYKFRETIIFYLLFLEVKFYHLFYLTFYYYKWIFNTYKKLIFPFWANDAFILCYKLYLYAELLFFLDKIFVHKFFNIHQLYTHFE